MKILLTGDKGFIGSHLKEYLPKDWQIYTYDLIMNGYSSPSMLFDDTFDWVLHMGGESSTTAETQTVMELNYQYTKDLYQACANKQVNLIYASSAGVYYEPNVEAPKSSYAASKWLVDKYIKETPISDIHCYGLRFFNVYGQNEGHKGSQASVFYKWKDEKQIKLFSNSSSYSRDFIHVDDCCNVIRQLIIDSKYVAQENGTIDVGTGNPVSFEEIAMEYSKVTGAKVKYIPMPEDLVQHYQKYTCADTTRVLEILGKDYKFITPHEYINGLRGRQKKKIKSNR